MAKSYSFSKIECFQKCRLQFKYRYIEKVPVEFETIEAFMGTKVHEVLEEFYGFVKNRVVKPEEWLLLKYESLWNSSYHDSIRIVKKEFSAQDYYEKGKKCISDYYREYKPFDQAKIVKTEELVYFYLKEKEGGVPFSGVIDRLDWNDKEKIFEIHDYKTSGTLMTQEEADCDVQLPLYQLALLDKWPEAKNAKLVWHFLLFNKDLESFRTIKQLMELQENVIGRIKEIEDCLQFPPNKSALCDWCGFQNICPLWKHPKKIEMLVSNEYKSDPGVKLVLKYSELEKEKKELKKKIGDIEQEQEKIEEAAIELAEKEGILVIDSRDKQLVVKTKDELIAPSRKEDLNKWEEFRDLLIQSEKYVEVSTVNNNMLNRMLKSWPQEFIDKIRKYLIRKVIKKVRLQNKI